MTNYLDIIKAPIITEKSANLEDQNKYAFLVDFKANKSEVKKAVEKLFNVKVKEVNIMTLKPKKRRVGRYVGISNRGKKAIITLEDGEKIDFE